MNQEQINEFRARRRRLGIPTVVARQQRLPPPAPPAPFPAIEFPPEQESEPPPPLRDFFTNGPRPSIPFIARLAAQYFGRDCVKVARSRKAQDVMARHIVFFVTCGYGHSSGSIGQRLGYDHSSVLNGRDRIRRAIERGNEEIITAVARIVERADRWRSPPKFSGSEE